MFKTILAVTDFSPNSLKVLPPTLALAKRFGACIHLCHVDEEEKVLPVSTSQELVTFLDQVESRRSAWLESLANQIREHELECEVVRLKGWASKEIMGYALSAGVDLTAISALGGQGFKAQIMGSTSTNVLRNLRGPILFVGANCAAGDDYEIRKVLYPTDFSVPSVLGTRVAVGLCKALSARMELFHVMKIPSYIPSLPGEPPLVVPSALVERLDERMEKLMNDLADELGQEVGSDVTIAADEADAICKAAVAKGADMIVIPKKGHGVLQGLLFGRVAENVARLSSVPVLLFHPPEEQELVSIPEGIR